MPSPVYLLQTPQCPLNQEHRDAWRNNGAVVFAPRLAGDQIQRVHAYQYDGLEVRDQVPTVINWGNRHISREQLQAEVHPDTRVWNAAEDIAWCVTPRRNREALGDLMGPDISEDNHYNDFWVKNPGRGGRNKFRVTVIPGDTQKHPEGTFQLHYEGTEYRAITVGRYTVQVFKRIGDNNNRSYEWVGVEAMSASGLVPLLRMAHEEVYGDLSPRRVIIGWDLMRLENGGWRILEANSAPGTNDDTVRRIMNQMTVVTGDMLNHTGGTS